MIIADNSSGSKGSIVRIFTNFSPSKFILPVSEGYKYCKICNRWVYNENRHCYKCCACTSKVIDWNFNFLFFVREYITCNSIVDCLLHI